MILMDLKLLMKQHMNLSGGKERHKRTHGLRLAEMDGRASERPFRSYHLPGSHCPTSHQRTRAWEQGGRKRWQLNPRPHCCSVESSSEQTAGLQADQVNRGSAPTLPQLKKKNKLLTLKIQVISHRNQMLWLPDNQKLWPHWAPLSPRD